jgi:hypothetical protein
MNEFAFLADVDRAERPDLMRLSMRLATTPCGPLFQRHVVPTWNSRPSSSNSPPIGRPGRRPKGQATRSAIEAVLGAARWLTRPMVAPLPEPEPSIDPDAPVPDDPGELLPDAPEPLPPAPIEPSPDDPGGDPGGVPEPA